MSDQNHFCSDNVLAYFTVYFKHWISSSTGNKNSHDNYIDIRMVYTCIICGVIYFYDINIIINALTVYDFLNSDQPPICFMYVRDCEFIFSSVEGGK